MLLGPPACGKNEAATAGHSQGCVKLLDFSLSSFGWRRGQGRGGAFLLASPLLGPPPSFLTGRGCGPALPQRHADRIRLVAPFSHDYVATRVHKIAFQLGPLPVYWYGVLVALGFLAGLWTASRRGVRDGLAPESIMDAGVWLILGTFIGARGLYVLTYWRESFADKPWTE